MFPPPRGTEEGGALLRPDVRTLPRRDPARAVRRRAHADGDCFVVVPLFLATLIAAAVCYGHLRLATASVWPAAIAHAAFNVVWERLHASTATTSPVALDPLARASGVTLAALVGAAWWLMPAAAGRAPAG